MINNITFNSLNKNRYFTLHNLIFQDKGFLQNKEIKKYYKILKGGSFSNTNNSLNTNINNNLNALLFRKTVKRNNNLLEINLKQEYSKNPLILYSLERNDNRGMLYIGRTQTSLCAVVEFDYKEKEAHILTLTKQIKCLKNRKYPEKQDISDIMYLIDEYCIENNIKKITLVDKSYFICDGIKISLANWFVAIYGRTYYDIKYGFTPINNKRFYKLNQELVENKGIKKHFLQLREKMDCKEINEELKKIFDEELYSFDGTIFQKIY